MDDPDFRELLQQIRALCRKAFVRRHHMKEMREWVEHVFSRIIESDVPEKILEAWRRLVAKTRDKLGIDLLAREIEAVISACRRALNAVGNAGVRDVLNSAGTLMDSIKKDVKLPPSIEITWNAAREAVDAATG